MYVTNGTDILTRVLVSKPDYLKAARINEIAKRWDLDLNLEKMKKEHQLFTDAYAKAGVKVEYLDSDPKRPNSVFSRDFGGCVREGYVMGRFKLPIRYKEHEDYKKKMADLGIPCLGEVKHGFFEGGDFMFINDHTIAIGMLDRTNEEGFEELKAILNPLGYALIPVKADPRYLHLDMCFNLVDPTIAVAYVDGLPKEFIARMQDLGIRFVTVEEEDIFHHGCNLQAIGDHRVLSLASNKKVNKQLREMGMQVIELDITEILKAGGGPHCMSFPLERRK